MEHSPHPPNSLHPLPFHYPFSAINHHISLDLASQIVPHLVFANHHAHRNPDLSYDILDRNLCH